MRSLAVTRLSRSAYPHETGAPPSQIDIADGLFTLAKAMNHRRNPPDRIPCGTGLTEDRRRMSINVEKIGSGLGDREGRPRHRNGRSRPANRNTSRQGRHCRPAITRRLPQLFRVAGRRDGLPPWAAPSDIRLPIGTRAAGIAIRRPRDRACSISQLRDCHRPCRDWPKRLDTLGAPDPASCPVIGLSSRGGSASMSRCRTRPPRPSRRRSSPRHGRPGCRPRTQAPRPGTWFP